MLVYVVEDNEVMNEMECCALSPYKYRVKPLYSGAELMEALEEQIPDVIVLDILLPDDNGYQIVKRLRKNERYKDIPIIIVSSMNNEMEKVRGLEAGTDDYMTKPFGVREFSARINALVRRSGAEDKMEPEDENVLNVGEVYLNVDSREVVSSGEFLELTYMEFELLRYFMLNKGIVLSREKLAEEVWGYDYEGETRTIDMHVKSLRSKLGANKELIKTVRYIGYKMEKDRWKPQI